MSAPLSPSTFPVGTPMTELNMILRMWDLWCTLPYTVASWFEDEDEDEDEYEGEDDDDDDDEAAAAVSAAASAASVTASAAASAAASAVASVAVVAIAVPAPPVELTTEYRSMLWWKTKITMT